MTGVTLGFHTQSPSSFSPSQSAVGGRGQRSGRLGTAAPQNLLLAAAAVPVLSPIYSVELSACGYRQEYTAVRSVTFWLFATCGIIKWMTKVSVGDRVVLSIGQSQYICQCRDGNQDVTTFVLSDL